MPHSQARQRPAAYTWETRETPLPALVAAASCQARPHTGLSGRIVHNQLWALDYTNSDAGLYRVGNTAAPWRHRPARTAHLYAPGTPYWEDTRPVARRIESGHMVFSGGQAADLERKTEPEHGFACFEDSEFILGELLQRTAEEGQRYGEDGFIKAQALLYEVLHLLQNALPRERSSWLIGGHDPSVGHSPFVERVLTYLKQNMHKKITLTTVSGHVHVSLSTLTHRYQKETGESPMKTLTRIRLNNAKSLLLRGYPLKHVAPATGFCDEYHLSKVFKKVEGLPPRTFVTQFRP